MFVARSINAYLTRLLRQSKCIQYIMQYYGPLFCFDGMVFSKFVESVLKNLSQHVDTDTDFWISQFSAKKYV